MSESKACDFLHGEIFFGYFLNASNHLHPWIATTIVMIFLWGIIFYIMFEFDSADFESEEGDDGDGDVGRGVAAQVFGCKQSKICGNHKHLINPTILAM